MQCQLTEYSIKISNEQVNIVNIITDMINWKSNLQNLSETAITASAHNNQDKSIYLYNIIDSTSYYLVTLWEGYTGGLSGSSNLTSIDINSPINEVIAVTNKTADNLVPGRPKIFIFPKSAISTCYALTWEYHKQTGSSLFKQYFTSFLVEHSKYVYKDVKASPSNNIDIDVTIEHPDTKSFFQNVNFQKLSTSTDRDIIIKHRKDISYIVRTSYAKSTINPDLEIWEKFIPSFISNLNSLSKKKLESKKTTSKVKYTPTDLDLDNLFNIFDNNQYGIENMRFEFTEKSGIQALSLAKSDVYENYELDFTFNQKTNLPDFQSLKRCLDNVIL